MNLHTNMLSLDVEPATSAKYDISNHSSLCILTWRFPSTACEALLFYSELLGKHEVFRLKHTNSIILYLISPQLLYLTREVIVFPA